MSSFERTYQIDPCRERNDEREKHPSIELSDEDYFKINLIQGCSPRIPLDVKTQEPEKTVLKGDKNEKRKSKSTEKKPKKVHRKANKAAVAKIQD